MHDRAGNLRSSLVKENVPTRVDTKFRDTKFREISHQKLISYFAKFLFYFAKFREISWPYFAKFREIKVKIDAKFREIKPNMLFSGEKTRIS
jgi:hypothetical protein